MLRSGKDSVWGGVLIHIRCTTTSCPMSWDERAPQDRSWHELAEPWMNMNVGEWPLSSMNAFCQLTIWRL
jgi:hypothetical protein